MDKEKYIDEIVNDIKYYIPKYLDNISVENEEVFIELHRYIYNAVEIITEEAENEKAAEGLKSITITDDDATSTKIKNIFININLYKWLEIIWNTANTAIAYESLGIFASLGLILILRDLLGLRHVKIEKTQAEILKIICLLKKGKRVGVSLNKILKKLNINERKYSKEELKNLVEPLIQINAIVFNSYGKKLYLNENVRFKK